MKVFVDEDGWVRCPVCSAKTRAKIRKDTVLINYPLFCPKCHRTTIIEYGNEARKTLEPDAKPQSR